MTYEEFNDFLMVHLWKQGDTVVLDALPTIIKIAEAELDRILKVTEREVIGALSVTATAIELPADCRSVRSVWNTRGMMRYISPAEFADNQARDGWAEYDGYTVANSVLLLSNNIKVTTPPGSVQVWYYSKILPFTTGTPSFLADNYFDVFLYAVLKHTAPFLREDERIQTWNAMYGAALGAALDEDQERRFAGSPIKTKFSNSIR